MLPENISMIDCICNTVGRDDDYDRSDENKYRDDDDDDDEEEEEHNYDNDGDFLLSSLLSIYLSSPID